MEGISCRPIWKAVSAIGWSIFTVQSAVCPLHASKIFEPLSTVEWDDFRLFANFDNFGPKRHARRVRNSYCCCCCCCCCCWLTCSVWLLWWEGWWVGRPVELSQLSGGRRNLSIYPSEDTIQRQMSSFICKELRDETGYESLVHTDWSR